MPRKVPLSYASNDDAYAYPDAETVDTTPAWHDATKLPASSAAPQHLFDVTAVIGSVFSGGDEDPMVVAMRIIGEHYTAAPAIYTFPNPDGLTVTVTVGTEKPAV